MSIRCHYIPQFYLNYFIQNEEGLLWVYDKKDVSVRRQQSLNTAVISDFYVSEKNEEGNKDDRVEKILADIEGLAKPILDSWIKNPSNCDSRDKEVVALFLSIMHCRVPRSVEVMKEFHEAGLDRALEYLAETSTEEQLKKDYEKFFAEPGSRMTYSEFCDFVKNPTKRYTYTISEKHMVGFSLKQIEIIQGCLLSMNWSLCRINGDNFFITCDAPLNVFVLDKFGYAIFGAGWGLPNAEVVFPLTPKLCIRAAYRSLPHYEKVGSDNVNEVNKRFIYMAEQYIFSPYKSSRIFSLVGSCAASYKTPKVDKEIIKKRLNFDRESGDTRLNS